MTRLTEFLITKLTMTTPETQTMSADEQFAYTLSMAELRRKVSDCPEHLFSTDDKELKPAKQA